MNIYLFLKNIRKVIMRQVHVLPAMTALSPAP